MQEFNDLIAEGGLSGESNAKNEVFEDFCKLHDFDAKTLKQGRADDDKPHQQRFIDALKTFGLADEHGVSQLFSPKYTEGKLFSIEDEKGKKVFIHPDTEVDVDEVDVDAQSTPAKFTLKEAIKALEVHTKLERQELAENPEYEHVVKAIKEEESKLSEARKLGHGLQALSELKLEKSFRMPHVSGKRFTLTHYRNVQDLSKEEEDRDKILDALVDAEKHGVVDGKEVLKFINKWKDDYSSSPLPEGELRKELKKYILDERSTDPKVERKRLQALVDLLQKNVSKLQSEKFKFHGSSFMTADKLKELAAEYKDKTLKTLKDKGIDEVSKKALTQDEKEVRRLAKGNFINFTHRVTRTVSYSSKRAFMMPASSFVMMPMIVGHVAAQFWNVNFGRKYKSVSASDLERINEYRRDCGKPELTPGQEKEQEPRADADTHSDTGTHSDTKEPNEPLYEVKVSDVLDAKYGTTNSFKIALSRTYNAWSKRLHGGPDGKFQAAVADACIFLDGTAAIASDSIFKVGTMSDTIRHQAGYATFAASDAVNATFQGAALDFKLHGAFDKRSGFAVAKAQRFSKLQKSAQIVRHIASETDPDKFRGNMIQAIGEIAEANGNLDRKMISNISNRFKRASGWFGGRIQQGVHLQEVIHDQKMHKTVKETDWERLASDASGQRTAGPSAAGHEYSFDSLRGTKKYRRHKQAHITADNLAATISWPRYAYAHAYFGVRTGANIVHALNGSEAILPNINQYGGGIVAGGLGFIVYGIKITGMAYERMLESKHIRAYEKATDRADINPKENPASNLVRGHVYTTLRKHRAFDKWDWLSATSYELTFGGLVAYGVSQITQAFSAPVFANATAGTFLAGGFPISIIILGGSVMGLSAVNFVNSVFQQKKKMVTGTRVQDAGDQVLRGGQAEWKTDKSDEFITRARKKAEKQAGKYFEEHVNQFLEASDDDPNDLSTADEKRKLYNSILYLNSKDMNAATMRMVEQLRDEMGGYTDDQQDYSGIQAQEEKLTDINEYSKNFDKSADEAKFMSSRNLKSGDEAGKEQEGVTSLVKLETLSKKMHEFVNRGDADEARLMQSDTAKFLLTRGVPKVAILAIANADLDDSGADPADIRANKAACLKTLQFYIRGKSTIGHDYANQAAFVPRNNASGNPAKAETTETPNEIEV